MKKLTVSEAANYFGITKEAIYNRVRRGKLKTLNENGLKYVVVEEDNKSKTKAAVKNRSNEDKYLIFLENEVKELKTKVKKLEEENAKLIKEKLEILESSKRELEIIFSKRDEQLKQILRLMNEKYALPKIESIEVIDTAVDKKPKEKKEKKKKGKKRKKGKK